MTTILLIAALIVVLASLLLGALRRRDARARERRMRSMISFVSCPEPALATRDFVPDRAADRGRSGSDAGFVTPVAASGAGGPPTTG